MRFLFALLLIIVGVVQYSAAANPHVIGEFEVHSSIGILADKYPMTEKDKLASDKAVQHAEYFRRIIQTGISNIPPLDPYRKEMLSPLKFNGVSTNMIGTLVLSNLEVTGAAAFSIADMKVYLKTHRMDFNITVPKIVATADFSAVNMIYGGLKFNTSGSIEVVLEGYRLQGAVSMLRFKLTDNYLASGLDVRVHVQKGSYTTDTPIGSPTKKDVSDVRSLVFDAVNMAALTEMNDVLRSYTMEQIDIFMEP